MPAVDSFVAFFPRFTTLVGSSVSTIVPVTSIPLDVTQFAGAQMEAFFGGSVWSFPPGETYFRIYLEESLDGVSWPDTMSTRYDFDVGTPNKSKFFSFGFRLRWFRIRIETNLVVTCYVEGLMRAGGGGAHEWVAVPRPMGPMGTADARRRRKPSQQWRRGPMITVEPPSPFKTPMPTVTVWNPQLAPGGGTGPGAGGGGGAGGGLQVGSDTSYEDAEAPDESASAPPKKHRTRRWRPGEMEQAPPGEVSYHQGDDEGAG